ncbi:MAG TPA: hypothetical protein PKM17_12165 [Syntrophorhabdus sp.]|nr:hypothetical protein [Syntrophorhabdus sp.]
MMTSANCQVTKQNSANLPSRSKAKFSTWHGKHIDNNKEKRRSANLPSKTEIYHREKIYIVEKGRFVLQTESGKIRLQAGNLLRALSTDPTVRKMLNAGVIRQATSREVIDSFVNEAKQLWDVTEV